MEVIAASRIVKAQQAARAAMPYTNELDHAMAALAFSNDEIQHPLITAVENPKRSALLLITSDRGLAGAYSTNAIKAAEQLRAKLLAEGQEVDLYVSGQKGVGYYDFRNVPVKQTWTGFSDAPTYERAREIAEEIWPWVDAGPKTELGRQEAEWRARTGRGAAVGRGEAPVSPAGS